MNRTAGRGLPRKADGKGFSWTGHLDPAGERTVRKREIGHRFMGIVKMFFPTCHYTTDILSADFSKLDKKMI